MKIDVSKLNSLRENVFIENVVFDGEKFKCHLPLVEVKNVNVELKIHNYQDFLDVNIKMTAKVVLSCSYTLKPFETVIRTKDEMHFGNGEEDEDLIPYNGNIIDMDKYLFDLLSASIPSSPKAPGSTLPKEGKGYRVLNEDEFFEEKKESGNNKFDCLKDLDFDD